MSKMSTAHSHESGQYDIRLEGHLHLRWTAWFDGMNLTHDGDGTTILHGQVVDQAALHGLLQKVRDLGLPLISITRVEPDRPDVPTDEPRRLINSTKESDMTTTVHATRTTATKRVPMNSLRKTAFVAGVLYLLTFVSIPTLALYKPVKDHVGTFVLGAGRDTGLMWGALSEIIVGLAGIGTAVVLYPVAKRVSQTAALGFVTARVLETSLIFVGVISLLTVVTLRNDVAGTAGADSTSLVTTGHSLVAVYNWTFLLSQSLLPVACDLLLGFVLYRSGLVPRILPIIAFVGAPLLLTSDIAVFFGAYARVSPLAALAALPVAAFEFSLGVWLVVKGFKPSAITAGMVAGGPPAYRVDA